MTMSALQTRPSRGPARSLGRSFIAVIADRAWMRRDDGAANVLRQLGADVRTTDLRGNPADLIDDLDEELGIRPRAILFEAVDRPDLARVALTALRKISVFESVGTLLAVSSPHVARIEPSSGFDDFVVFPYSPVELYARIRALEWRRSEFETDERHKLGQIVVDKAAHEVTVDGRAVLLTPKEFALLAYLCEHRGRALSREHLLSRVWGKGYIGGRRTVDIHVRRLRAKLGEALPLETLRGWGYRLCAPEKADAEPAPTLEVVSAE
jgi:DNA-binding winged helix-turn-helix (wHTH) protein